MTARDARRAHAVTAATSGLVLAASTPPLDLAPGVVVGLALLAASLMEGDDQLAPRARDAALRGLLFGVVANLVGLRFVPEVIVRFTPLPLAAGALALVLLAMAQALPWALGALVARALRARARVPAWLAVALGVYAATFVPAVFPWTPAGGLSAWPALLQSAELVGERGTSFLLACASALLGTAARRAWSSRRASSWDVAAPALGSAAVLAALSAHGLVRMREVDAARATARTAHVALVQPGFDASDRWEAARAAMMLDRLSTLTRAAEGRGAELTVWPESAYPYSLPHGTRRSPPGARAVLQPGVRGPVLTGVYMTGARGVGYNSAVLATADGALGPSYDKRHLLWFGETVPLSDVFPWLKRVFARGTGLEAGTTSKVFEAGAVRAAVLNCYEDTLPAAGREALEGAPNLLVNITNDAWFVGSAEGELHLRLAVLRAIETRRDLARAVNRGPTSLVEASGLVGARYDADLPASLHVEAALLDGPPTPYARFGDAPLLLAVAAATATRGLLAVRRRRSGEP